MRLIIPDPWTPPGEPVEITVPDRQIETSVVLSSPSRPVGEPAQ